MLLRSKAIPKKNEDPKGYSRVDNFVRNNIMKYVPDKTLPKVGSVNGRSERTTAPASKQLEEAVAAARRAVHAEGGHEAALRALAPVVKAASAVVPMSASVWKGVGEAAVLLRSKAIPEKKADSAFLSPETS